MVLALTIISFIITFCFIITWINIGNINERLPNQLSPELKILRQLDELSYQVIRINSYQDQILENLNANKKRK